jgi:hypothetical protein
MDELSTRTVYIARGQSARKFLTFDAAQPHASPPNYRALGMRRLRAATFFHCVFSQFRCLSIFVLAAFA